MRIPEVVKTAINNYIKPYQGPLPLATCNYLDENKQFMIPNLIFVSFLKIYDDETLLLSNNKFFKTLKNLEDNPYMAVAIYDKKENKSYQIKGKVTMHKKLVWEGDEPVFK